MARGGLLFVHRISIAAAIGLSGLLLVYGVARFSTRGDAGALATGAIAAAVGCGLAVYLRWMRRNRGV